MSMVHIQNKIGWDDESDYVKKIAWAIDKSYQIEYDEDGSGGIVSPPESLSGFINQLSIRGFDFPFTYEDYINNTYILDTVDGYGMDRDKFWNAILYVYYFVKTRCNDIPKKSGVLCKELEEAIAFLQENVNVEIAFKANKNKLTVKHAYFNSIINKALIDYYSEYSGNALSLQSTSFRLDGGRYSLSQSEHIVITTRLFKALFEELQLPNKRSIGATSLSKLLLISRLVYFMRFTYHDGYLFDEDCIKGVLKHYKDVEILYDYFG